MDASTLLAGLAGGVAGGGALGFILGVARARGAAEPARRDAEARARAAEAMAEERRRAMEPWRERVDRLTDELRRAEAERAAGGARAEELSRALGEQRELLDQMKTQVGTTFQAAAAEAMQQSSEGFLRLASERLGSLQQQGAGDLEARQQAIASLLGPLRQSLEKVDQHARDLERARGLALGELREQLRTVAEGQDRLRAETGNLVNALAAPAVRGRWGEIQLRRVLEVAGMQDHCDFETQPTLSGPEGRLRPDVVVNLPGGRRIAVDAKAPMGAFLDALATSDDGDRRAHLRQHAEQVRAHLEKLSAKNYWDGLGASLELVVMFLPGDALYQAALEQAPGLVEEALSHRVVIATPMTLIGVLRAVHAAWREENLAANAEELGRCGRELHERIATMAEHLDGMGGALHRTVEAFNRTVGSFESRVLPGARRIAELGSAGKKALPDLQPVDLRPRSASASVIPVGTRDARGERARALSVAAPGCHTGCGP